jgi:hypothetical protein
MNRALPAWAIDLIRDGVPARDLQARGNAAVWTALVRTASSAHQRGHDRSEWESLVLAPASNLGRQVRLKDGTRERTVPDVIKTMADAWDAAVEWVSQQPPAWTREQTAAVAAERAAAALQVAADADLDLTGPEREVLAFAAREHDRRGYLQVALPRAAVVAETGLGERTVRTALAGLARRGLLTVAVPGRTGADPKRRKATLYALADAEALTHYLCRETRPMGPPTQTYGTPEVETSWTPLQTYGTPTPTTPTGDPAMADTITLTLTAEERAAVLHTLSTLRATATAEPERAAEGGKVVPLRRAAGDAR